MVGRTLGHYTISARLGAGSMGEVYRAQDHVLGRQVAIKLLPAKIASHPALVERFRQEARTLAALNHPGIVMIFSVEEEDGVHFMTMELAVGPTLDELIPADGFDLERLLDIALPIAEALAEAHDRGVVHRDLKPANVLVDERQRVKLLDFGLAKVAEGADGLESDASTLGITSDGQVVGTVPYMSPEQVEGKAIDRRSDIFSLGTMLYEMATGRRPFVGDSKFSTMMAIANDNPPPLATWRGDHPRRLELIIHRCLQKRRSRRYQTAHELHRDLETLRAVMGSGTTASQPPLPAAARRRPETLDGAPPLGPSIAVLPFTNLSDDAENQYFGDGLAEELINVLGRIEGLDVPARTSSFRFRGAERDIRQIGRQLGVATVLEGSVRRAGERVRITVQLVSVADGYNLWAQTYDRRLDDIFAIQDEVARAIAEELEVELRLDGGSQAVRRYTADPAAYEAYLKGRYFWYRRDRAGMEKAHECFTRALELDPDYALARVGLSDVYWTLATYALTPPRPALERARCEVLLALERVDDLAEAHASLATVDLLEAKWNASEAGFQRAIALQPGYGFAHAYYGVLLSVQFRLRAMNEQIRLATRAEPLSQYIFGLASLCHLMTQDYDSALPYARSGLELDPGSIINLWCLGLSQSALGQHTEAIETLQLAMDVTSGNPAVTGMLAYAHARAGDAARAVEIAELANSRLEPSMRAYYFFPLPLALGDADTAHRMLSLGLDEGIPPQWLCFYGRPFPDLLARIGLPAAPVEELPSRSG